MLYRAGAVNEWVKEMDKYKIDVCAVQEIRWPGKGTVITKNYMILYSAHKSDKCEFGRGFYISKYIMDELLDFEPTSERIYKLRVKLKYYNLMLVSTNVLTE
jgi:hypothetical protein